MNRVLTTSLVLALLVVTRSPALGGATWIVDDPADPVPMTGTLTLRQAILQANAAPGTSHHIVFSIPMPGMVGIPLLSPLPAIAVDSVWIDGFSQPGATPGAQPPGTATLLVMLDGSMAGPGHGLVLASSFNTIEGLSIVNFEQDGIRIEGTALPGTRGNLVHACFVGTDVTGTLGMGNGFAMGGIWAGIDILCTPGPLTYCYANRVTNNLVSANFRCGVQISSCPPSDCHTNYVLSNWIGSNVTGSQVLGNVGTGVSLSEGTHDNVVATNSIAASGANGVDLTGNSSTVPPASTDRNQFLNNLIGIAGDGVTACGNGARGIAVGIFEHSSRWGYCCDNRFQSNTIANNMGCGAAVWESPLSSTNCDRNAFLANAYCANGGPDIDLGDDGTTLNDAGDLDTGANQLLNHPIVMVAGWSGGTTVLQGFVDNGAQVHLYGSSSGLCGAGAAWLGSVTPDALGNWHTTLTSLSPGDLVSAIAMDWIGGTTSNTSEFAPPMTVLNLAGVDGESSIAFGLWVAGTNPFCGRVPLRYRMSAPGPASLAVYDVMGQRVRTLLAGATERGEYTTVWDGCDARGRNVPAGVYFVRFVANGERASCRLVRLP